LLRDLDSLLWHLTIIEKCGDALNSSEHEYEMILLLNHAISEGKNSHWIMMQLLEIIESNLNDPSFETRTNLTLLPPIEDLYYKNYSDKERELESTPLINYPQFLKEKIDETFLTNNSFSGDEKLLDKIVYSYGENHNLIEHMRLRDLIESSKSNSIKISRLMFEEERTTKLMKKCKAENCKLTGALNVLSCFALNKYFKKHGYISKVNESDIESTLPYYTAISLRQFNTIGCEDIVEQVNNYEMGFYVTGMMSKIVVPEFNDELFKEEFWKYAREDTRQLHERLKRGDAFIPLKSAPIPADMIIDFHGLSNLGVLPNRPTPSSKIHIIQGFSEINLERSVVAYGLNFFFISTVNNQLCVSIVNNGVITQNSFINEFINNFKTIFDSLLD
jgi:hypothetical protein